MKVLCCAVAEIISFLVSELILWNYTKMDIVEMLWIGLAVCFSVGLCTILKLEESEDKKYEHK